MCCLITSVAGAVSPEVRSWFQIEQNDPAAEIVLRITIPEPDIALTQLGGETVTVVSLPGCGALTAAGQPALPFVSAFVSISPDRDVILAVEPLLTERRRLKAPVAPSRGPDAELFDVSEPLLWNDTVYAGAGWLPAGAVELHAPEIFRDLRVVQVAFFPVRYAPATGEIEIVRDIRIRLKAGSVGGGNTLTRAAPITGTWAQLYEATVINFEQEDAQRESPRENYLIVAPDAFILELADLAAWKNEQGYNARAVAFSQIGETLTDTLLRSYLYNQYQNLETRPTYVLLVGDADIAPTHYFSSPSEGSLLDDLYFSLMDGSDYLADFNFSRLPAANLTELRTMLAKWRYWERTPNMSEPLYYKTAVLAAANRYPSQQYTKEQTQDKLQNYLDFTRFYTMYSWTSGSATQVRNWLTQGASVLNYRGEGWFSGWNPANGSFHSDQVEQIFNINKITMVTSIGCGVGQFNQSYDCFGETWMKLGSPTELRGAVVFIGPTGNTHTTYNNWLDRGIYGGLAWYKINRFAVAVNYGKMFMRDHFWGTPDEWRVESMAREYAVFGVPDTIWRTRLPVDLWVGTGFCRNSMGVTVRVRYPAGENIRYALVKLAWDDVVKAGYTDRDGIIEFEVPTGLNRDQLNITVTAQDGLPYVHELYFPDITGDLLITELKSDIEATGDAGDLVELYNQGAVPVNLRGWSLSDLDMSDPSFMTNDLELAPGEFAVIEFAGNSAFPFVQNTDYGVFIRADLTPDFSSSEDLIVLRDPRGRVVDCLAYHNGDGTASRNKAVDLSRLTGRTSALDRQEGGYWGGPDVVSQDEYELLTIDWSAYAGNGGEGSITRKYNPYTGRWLQTDGIRGDWPENFDVLAATSFGGYGPAVTPPPVTDTPQPTPEPSSTPAQPTMTPLPTESFTPGPSATPAPTVTPTPSIAPTSEPTATPSAAPSATPTATPAVTLTPPPTAEATATPSPEPTAESEIILRLYTNKANYAPGDRFALISQTLNPYPALIVRHYLALDVAGSYWFWPSWTPDIDFANWTIPGPGNSRFTYLDFSWPSGAGSASGITFWAVLLDPSGTELVSDLVSCQFSFSEP